MRKQFKTASWRRYRYHQSNQLSTSYNYYLHSLSQVHAHNILPPPHIHCSHQEIVIHQNKYDELQEEIAELKSKIKRLSDHVEKRTESRHRSPLAKLGKCLPNTEFQLDFPRQQQFPL